MTAPIGRLFLRKNNRWWPLLPTTEPPPPTGSGVSSIEVDLHFPAPGELTGLTEGVHDLGIARRMWHQLAGVLTTRVKASLSDVSAGAAQLEAFYVDENGDDQFLGSFVVAANGVIRGNPAPLPLAAGTDVILGVRLNTGDTFAGDLTIERLSIGLFAGDGLGDEGDPPPSCEITPVTVDDFVADAVENDTQDIMTPSVAAHPDGGLDALLLTHTKAADAVDPDVYHYGYSFPYTDLLPGVDHYLVCQVYWDDNGTPLDFTIAPNVRTTFAFGPVVPDILGNVTFVLNFTGQGNGADADPDGLLYFDNFTIMTGPCAVDPTPGGGGGGPSGEEEVPPPDPIVGDNPFMAASLPASGGGVFNGTVLPVRASDIEAKLDLAEANGQMLLLLLGGPQGVHNPSRHNLLVDAYRQNMADIADNPTLHAAVAAGIAGGWVFGAYILDEPNLVDRWGRVVSAAEYGLFCQDVQDYWPGMRMFLRQRPSLVTTHVTAGGVELGYWLSYARRKGAVNTLLNADVAACQDFNNAPLFTGMNVIDFYDLNGTSATAADIITYGTPLAQHSYPIGMSFWEYRSSYYNGPGIAQAFEDLGNLFQAAHP